MTFEPATLSSRLLDMCRELGCPPGRDLVQWLREEIVTLRQELAQSQIESSGAMRFISSLNKIKQGKLLIGDLLADGPKFKVDTEMGIEIGFDGYGTADTVPGSPYGNIVYIEYYQEELVLRVWGDINDEEPTHTISLEGARESKRKETEE